MTITTLAQEVKVLDKETGKPIKNVNVFSASEQFNSFTGEDGKVDISSVKASGPVLNLK